MKRNESRAAAGLSLSLMLFLGGCNCGDREERIAEARARQGLDNPVEVIEVLSPAAQLYRDKTCNTCHGNDGIETLLPNYPVLARQGEEYALQQMKDIKSGERANAQTAAMKPIIAGVTDEEMAILAKYIATELGAEGQIGTGNVDEQSPGAVLFKKRTCIACHGADGATPILKSYPRIAGQNREYALQQMRDIKAGTRANSMAVLGMKGVMHLVNDDELHQLADYIASMPRPLIETAEEPVSD